MLTGRPALFWTAMLAATAVVGSYALACILPFAGLAAVAALTLDRRNATLTVAAAVAANQLVGFALLDYPHEASTYAWGGVIAFAAATALGAATALRGAPLMSARSAVALAAAVAGYQAVMFAGAAALDGFASSTPAIVGAVVLNDVLWFTGLMAAWFALARITPRHPATA